MKRENGILEVFIVSFISAFAGSLLLLFFKDLILGCVISAIFTAVLIIIYSFLIRPQLENLLFKGEWEPTQTDQYKCENESESAGEEE